ncbi:MAG: hypothetical protein CL608_03645 [Anaerolineaceae bacterium]|nr:hypothetical protein [Anaerolineaceae bacterium]
MENHHFEYEIMITQVNGLMERRQNVTTIYLSVNAAIITVIAFLLQDVQQITLNQQVPILLLLLSGLAACDLWRRLIRDYRKLLNWWYEQIRKLETKLENDKQIITREYNDLYKYGSVGLTKYETRLAWLFTIVYLVFLIGTAFTALSVIF